MHAFDSTGDVRAHQYRVAQLLMQVANAILERAAVHDESKLLPPEKAIFDEVIPSIKKTAFGTPEYEEQKQRLGDALAHHYAVNRHHPQYHPNGVNDMNLIDQIEMLADWKAAGERGGATDTQSLTRSLEFHRTQGTISEQQWRVLAATAIALGWIAEA